MEASSVQTRPMPLETSSKTDKTQIQIGDKVIKLPINDCRVKPMPLPRNDYCWFRPIHILPVIKLPPNLKIISIIKRLLEMLKGIGCQKPGNLQELVKLLKGGSVRNAMKAISKHRFTNFRVLPEGTMTTQVYTPGLVTIYVGKDGRVSGISIQPKEKKDNKVILYERYSAI